MNKLPAETPAWREKFNQTLINEARFYYSNRVMSRLGHPIRSSQVKIGVFKCKRHNRWEEKWTFQKRETSR